MTPPQAANRVTTYAPLVTLLADVEIPSERLSAVGMGLQHDAGKDTARPQHRRRWAIVKLVAAIAGLVAVMVASAIGQAISTSGAPSPGIATVEWIRDHHGAELVNAVERWWYSHHPPPVGGQPGGDLTFAAGTPAGPTGESEPDMSSPARTPPPQAVVTPAGTPLPNEGVWQPVGPPVHGVPAMYATQLRPDNVHTSLVAGLVWIDPKLARLNLEPGLSEPGGHWSQPSQIPLDQRLGLMAAFNSGFRTKDGNGGFYLSGDERVPLQSDLASFVIYDDGTATIGAWNRDVSMNDHVTAVRQNLPLIVDGGQPVPGLEDEHHRQWGATLGNKILVWRSAACVDSNGGVIYGAGPGLSALTLAQLMQRAGCQRAMELDINSEWTTFNLYSPTSPSDPTTVHGTKLLDNMSQSADRYLNNDSRDFFAIFSR